MATTSTRLSSRFPSTGLPDCRPKPSCDPAPVCPACGGLECLCRPRFFAGQLLTEDDLNRLDDYVVAKNRLHNRYLHGWGVACGLEVVCSVCDPAARGSVIVRPGYALSPCGNDIIVCRDQPVNICDLIARCRPADDMCLSATAGANAANANDPCAGGTEDWILGICYTERPSRGVTALLNASDPSKTACGCKTSGCGCGGSGKAGCGCGCQGKKQTAARPKAPAPECEPTLTCESYSFAVWKAPKKVRGQVSLGDAARRFICCIQPFLGALGQYPSNATADQLTQWYYDLRETVRQFLLDEGLYDCTIAARLAAATTPNTAGTNTIAVRGAVLDASYAVISIGAIVLQKCLCAALLPPCADMADADCVPLATITVKRRPCEVVKICNMSARKFLITIPNIQYWLSFLTLLQNDQGTTTFRDFLESICCVDLESWTRDFTKANGGTLFAAANIQHAAALQQGAFVEASNQSGSPFASILLTALAQPNRPVNAATLMLAALGAQDAQGQPLASDFELAHPSDFLLANQVVAPALRAVVPMGKAALGGLMGAAAASPTAAAASPAAVAVRPGAAVASTDAATAKADAATARADAAAASMTAAVAKADARASDLAGQLAALRKTLADQQQQIDKMRKARGRGKG